MNSVILGNRFFERHNITIDPKGCLLPVPDSTVQLNQFHLILTKKAQKAPQSQVILVCNLAKLSDQYHI